MLIDKPITENDIVSIKLSNGDEIIAKLSEITESKITITKPLLMVLSQDPRTGQPGVQMAPFWMMGSDPSSKYAINRSHVIVVTKSNTDAASSYISQTTGLAMPGTGAGLVL